MHHATQLTSEVFGAFEHNHEHENDKAVVFKRYIREAMDRVLKSAGRGVGAKTLRSQLTQEFGPDNPDIPNKRQVKLNS